MSCVVQMETTEIITQAAAHRRIYDHQQATMTRSKATVNILNDLSNKWCLSVQRILMQRKTKEQNKNKPKMNKNSRSNNTIQEGAGSPITT